MKERKQTRGYDKYKKSEKIVIGISFTGKNLSLLNRMEKFRVDHFNVARGAFIRAALEEFLSKRGR